jgi:hypothetical protein
MNTYVVTQDAWIYGRFYKKGEKLRLMDKQAKYELLAGNLTLEDPTVDTLDD